MLAKLSLGRAERREAGERDLDCKWQHDGGGAVGFATHDRRVRHRQEDDKSAFLAQAGYTLENSARLLRDLREQILTLDAEVIGPFEYGMKFRIRGVLCGPNGRPLRIASVWVTLETTGETKFVTPYPAKP